jgi:hypothetical protein
MVAERASSPGLGPRPDPSGALTTEIQSRQVVKACKVPTAPTAGTGVGQKGLQGTGSFMVVVRSVLGMAVDSSLPAVDAVGILVGLIPGPRQDRSCSLGQSSHTGVLPSFKATSKPFQADAPSLAALLPTRQLLPPQNPRPALTVERGP